MSIHGKRESVIAEAIEDVVEKAPKKDIGFLVRVIAVAIFIVAVGIAVMLVLRGQFSYTRENTKVNKKIEEKKIESSGPANDSSLVDASEVERLDNTEDTESAPEDASVEKFGPNRGPIICGDPIEDHPYKSLPAAPPAAGE